MTETELELGIGHISPGAIGRECDIERITPNLYRGRDGMGRGIDHRHVVRAGVCHIGASPVGSNSDMNRIRSVPMHRKKSSESVREFIPNWYRRHHGIGGRADHRDAVGTGVGYIHAAAVGSDGGIDRAPAHLYRGRQAVGGGVNDGDRVRARIGDVGGGSIGSEGRINGVGAYRDGGNDGISRGVDHRDALGTLVCYVNRANTGLGHA